MRKNRDLAVPSDLQLDLMLALYEGAKGASELLLVLGELRGDDVPLATFYRQLQRAADAGWVMIGVGAAVSRGPGRPGREYRITDSGTAVLRLGFEGHWRRLARAQESGLLVERGL